MITLHFTLFMIVACDLFAKSKRTDKTSWLLFLLLVPFFSKVIYLRTMHRKKKKYR
jgi:hypothetical protein